MLTEDHDEDEGRQVWLSEQEVDSLVALPDDQQHRLALKLGARCGLRSHEIIRVAPEHVLDTDAGTMLMVPEGKGDKYRETPMPDPMAASIRTVDEYRPEPASEPLVDKSTRTLRRWIQDYRAIMREDTGDDRWQYLTTHDLRRTWAGQLANADVDDSVALRWGGWTDLETFLDHYRGEATAAKQLEERGKVDWL